jgi:tetratricopeptide (TPR) repeat protein
MPSRGVSRTVPPALAMIPPVSITPALPPTTAARHPAPGGAMSTRVFLSYSTADRSLATTLKGALADRIDVWIDREQLAGGDALKPLIKRAIQGSAGLVVLVTPDSAQSTWVRREVAHARKLGLRVVPVFVGEAPDLFPDLVGIPFEPLPAAQHRILSALGLDPLGEPVELVLSFREAVAGEPIEATVSWVDFSGRFRSPLGTDEAGQIRWYLEKYFVWPADVFAHRARGIEEKLPQWGRALWDAVLGALGPGSHAAFSAWLAASEPPCRRILTIQVEAGEPQGMAALLALPWELLSEAEGWLFHTHRIALRRRVPGNPSTKTLAAPIRVLVVAPRPEQAGLIDPRASSALFAAVEPLGAAVEVEFLRPPTVPALVKALQTGRHHVLHFNGHGVYDPHTGLGCLCFEHEDPAQRASGVPHTIPGTELREMLGRVTLPLAFLEACQGAQQAESGNAVAAALLAAGAGQVIAMSHSILVEAARRFTAELYRALCEGLTVGGAVNEARRELYLKRDRGRGPTGPGLSLRDWFGPVLFQQGDDQPLLPGGMHLHPPDARHEETRAFAVSSLRPMEHGFVGRWREHLALERAFEPGGARIGLILGIGGQGKTTLAAEMGRWFYRTDRFPGGVAFVSMEQLSDLTGVLATLGRAAIPGFALRDVEQGKAELKKHARAKPTLFVFDNFESVLPPAPDSSQAEQWLHEPAFLAEVLKLAHELAHLGDCRVIITSREAIDDDRFRSGRTTFVVPLGPLSRVEAIELVGEICRHEGIRPEAASEEARGELVDAVGCHPQALVLLPALLRGRGLAEVTENLHALMVELERKYPGHREKSLYASVKLSLDRLPKEMREKLAPLGLLRVGISLPALGLLLKPESEDVRSFAEALTRQALAQVDGSYLRFHPALPPFLEAELRIERPTEVERIWQRVVEVYSAQMGILYALKDGSYQAVTSRLATQEFPNLLRVLNHLATAQDADGLEKAIDFAVRLEALLATTRFQHALTAVAAIRNDLAGRRGAHGDWSHAQFDAARNGVEQLLRGGRTAEALTAVESLVQRTEAAGPEAYAHANYDRAAARQMLGRVLTHAGRFEAARTEIEVARQGFLACTDEPAARMASVCLAESGDCHRALGKLDDAMHCYGQALDEFRRLEDRRSEAAIYCNIATLRSATGQCKEALQDLEAALQIFADIGDPTGKAAALFYQGEVFWKMGDLAAAEVSYQRVLRISHEQGRASQAAKAMGHLATIADETGRLEEAVAWDQEALRTFQACGDRYAEATSRNNLANRLCRVGRLAEAEAEARRAIAILDELGLGSEPWAAWINLHMIACARGDIGSAAEARTGAMERYGRYRAQGGYPQNHTAPLFVACTEAITADNDDRAIALLAEFTSKAADCHPSWQPVLSALSAVLKDKPDAARAELSHLDPLSAVELERLLAGTWP